MYEDVAESSHIRKALSIRGGACSHCLRDKTRFAPDGFIIPRRALLLPRMGALKEAFRQSIREAEGKVRPIFEDRCKTKTSYTVTEAMVGLSGPERD